MKSFNGGDREQLCQLRHIFISRNAEDTFKMTVQMGQVCEAECSHCGIDILILLDGLSGMFDLAVQEKLIGEVPVWALNSRMN